ncbi:hypothetical protein U1Q18_043814 [Sarracenia purpurea var. burkii]
MATKRLANLESPNRFCVLDKLDPNSGLVSENQRARAPILPVTRLKGPTEMVIDDALEVCSKLKEWIRSEAFDKDSARVVREELKALNRVLIESGSDPDPFSPAKMAVLEARIRMMKGFSPIKQESMGLGKVNSNFAISDSSGVNPHPKSACVALGSNEAEISAKEDRSSHVSEEETSYDNEGAEADDEVNYSTSSLHLVKTNSAKDDKDEGHGIPPKPQVCSVLRNFSSALNADCAVGVKFGKGLPSEVALDCISNVSGEREIRPVVSEFPRGHADKVFGQMLVPSSVVTNYNAGISDGPHSFSAKCDVVLESPEEGASVVRYADALPSSNMLYESAENVKYNVALGGKRADGNSIRHSNAHQVFVERTGPNPVATNPSSVASSVNRNGGNSRFPPIGTEFKSKIDVESNPDQKKSWANIVASNGSVHMCNKIASRHVWVGLADPRDVPRCDICENAPAFFYCEIDDSSLCLHYDMIVHVGALQSLAFSSPVSHCAHQARFPSVVMLCAQLGVIAGV